MASSYGHYNSFEALQLRFAFDVSLSSTDRACTNIIGIISGNEVNKNSTIYDIVGGELLENVTTGYVGTSCVGASMIPTLNPTTDDYESGVLTYTLTIPVGQTYAFKSISYLRNVQTWGRNRVISSINTSTDTLTVTGTIPPNGSLVCFNTAAGGTLPAGLSATTTYQVANGSGSTIQLQPVGGGSLIDITSAGSGAIYMRNASGQPIAFRSNDTTQNATAQFSFVVNWQAGSVVVSE
jgi:hypothetical protein